MADKTVVITQQSRKPLKIVKWKVNEGNSISVGCVMFLYNNIGDDNKETLKLKSTKAGTVHRIVAQEGDVVKFGETLLELQACIHDTVMKDMCAECGADLRKDDLVTTASVPMIHTVPELKVSVKLAKKLGKADSDRLLKDRKLVLLVDLDQTLIHTTNDNIPANLKDVYHFQLYGVNSPWYHTRLRPGTHRFLTNMASLYELHICTFGARNYAHMIAMFLDQDGQLFSHRILSRDECFNPNSKTANLKALFPCGDNMVCIIDDREDVWSYASNLIHVKPYHFFQHTGDINAPPGLDKHEDDEKQGVDLTKVQRKPKIVRINGSSVEETLVIDKRDTDQDDQVDSNKLDEAPSENEVCVANENSVENLDNKEILREDLNENNLDKNEVVNCETGEKNVKMEEKELKEIINNGILKKNNGNKIETKTVSFVEDKISKEINNGDNVTKENNIEVSDKTNEKINDEKTNDEKAINEKTNDDKINDENAIDEKTNDDKTNDENAIDEKTNDEKANDGKTNDDKTNDEKAINEKTNDDKTNDENAIDEKTNDEKANDGKTNDDKTNDEKAMDEKTNDEKAIDEKTNDDKTNDEKAINEKTNDDETNDDKTNDRKTNDEKMNDDKIENKINDTANERKEEELIEIEDPDDYLVYLEDILKIIHHAFYEKYDKMESGEVPDLKKVIPEVRSNVLKGTKLVFSGLVPTHIKLEQSRAYQVARSLGAVVTQDLEIGTTHLVAVRPGTAKVNAGRRKKTLKIVTPDWLWACAERWERVEENLYTLNNKGSKNRHPPPHCSSPEHIPNFDMPEPGIIRKRTPSGRFMDTINPLMSFSSADIADMDREVEDIFNESESESEVGIKRMSSEVDNDSLAKKFKPYKDTEDESSSSDESLTGEHPHGWNPKSNSRKRTHDDPEQEAEDESTADEFPSIKFRRGEELSSDLEFGQESNSEGSMDAPDEIDDGDWNMMGAALEREFLSNN